MAYHVRARSAQRLAVPLLTPRERETRDRTVEPANKPAHVLQGGFRDHIGMDAVGH